MSGLSNYVIYHRTERETGKILSVLKSVVETKRTYCNHCNVRDASDRLTVWRIERAVHNVNKGRSGRPKSVRNQDNIDAVCLSMKQSLKKSTRTRKVAKPILVKWW